MRHLLRSWISRWFEVTADPFFDREGNLIGAVHIMVDVTERKKLEDALKAAVVSAEDEKSRADSIIAAIGDGVTIQDRDFRIVYQNQASKKMLGDHLGELCYMAYEKREQRCEGCGVAMVFEDGEVHTVVRSAPTDKGMMFFEITASPLRDSKGNIIAGIEVVHDITERKRAYEALQKIQALLNETGKIAKIGGWEFDTETLDLVWTEEVYRIHEVEMTYKPTVGGAVAFYTHTSRPFIEQAVQRAIEYGETFDEELQIITAMGNLRWVHAIGRAHQEQGKTNKVFGVFQDITERKMLEEQLTQITREWEETFNTITDMVTVHDKDFNIIRANKAAEKILGLPFLEVKKVKCFEYYHGTGCPPAGCPSCQSLVTGKPSTFELFEPHLKMYIEIQAIPRLDSNNEVVGLIHVVRDISERKKAEDLLKEERNKAQKYLDVAGVMIVALDFGGRITLINKKGLEILGYEEQEVIDQNWFDLCHARSRSGRSKRFS